MSSHIFSFGRFGCVVSKFPSDPLVKTPSSQCRGMGLIPGQGTKITHATWYSPNERETETGWGQS